MIPEQLSSPDQLLIRTKNNQNILDEDGRPLGESRADQEIISKVPMDFRNCPYSGSRKNHKKHMNVSALKRMRKGWKSIILALAEVNTFYSEFKKLTHFNIIDLYIISLAAKNLPVLYEHLRIKGVFNSPLPKEAADAFKIFIGVLSVLEKIFYEKDYLKSEHNMFTSKEIVNYSEKNQLFVGQNEVCAGPENLILEVLDIFFKPKESTLPPRLVKYKEYFFKLFRLGEIIVYDKFLTFSFKNHSTILANELIGALLKIRSSEQANCILIDKLCNEVERGQSIYEHTFNIKTLDALKLTSERNLPYIDSTQALFNMSFTPSEESLSTVERALSATLETNSDNKALAELAASVVRNARFESLYYHIVLTMEHDAVKLLDIDQHTYQHSRKLVFNGIRTSISDLFQTEFDVNLQTLDEVIG